MSRKILILNYEGGFGFLFYFVFTCNFPTRSDHSELGK